MDKRGDVPLGLIVGVAFVSLLLVVWVFLSFDADVKGKPSEMTRVINSLEFGQKYVINEAVILGKQSILQGNDIKKNFASLASENDRGIINFGNFFAKIRNNEFRLKKNGKEYRLEIDDIFIQSEAGTNKITRHFDVKIDFNEAGDVQKVYK